MTPSRLSNTRTRMISTRIEIIVPTSPRTPLLPPFPRLLQVRSQEPQQYDEQNENSHDADHQLYSTNTPHPIPPFPSGSLVVHHCVYDGYSRLSFSRAS